MTISNGVVPDLELRPSSLEILSACPASAITSAGLPSLSGSDAAEGNALEAGIYRGASGEPWDAAALAQEFSVTWDVIDAGRAISWAVAWFQENMPHARFQQKVATGTVDALQIDSDPTTLDVTGGTLADIKRQKFGETDPDERWQQNDYAVQVTDKYGLPTLKAVIVYPYQQRVTNPAVVYGPREIELARKGVEEIKARARRDAEEPVHRRSYRPGDHCKFCRGFSRCPAIEQEGARVGAMLQVISQPGFALDIERLPSTYAMVSRVVETFDGKDSPWKRFVSQVLEERGEVVENGQVLKMSSRTNNPKVKYEDAVAWLLRENKDLAERMDRELTSALPPAGKSWFPKLSSRKEKK